MNLNETAKKWREGPCLNEKRDSSASVVCNGTVFILGGYNYDDDLDTVETIEVGDLLLAPGADSTTNGWKTLDCRLSAKRSDCSAAAVHDRFIVVVGGGNTKDISSLSSVDIIDTTSKSQYAVVSGPPLNKGRYFFGMAVIGQRIYVVGGQPANNKLPVEYLEFEDCSNHADVTVTSVFPSTKSWKIQEELALDTDRCQHCVVEVGSCLVVAGGWSRDKEGLSSVEVMDTEQHVMWKLPSTTTKRNSFSMVAISNGILAISGDTEDSCEYLALTEKKTETKVCIAACCLCFWGTSHFSCLTVGCCLLQKSCSSHLVLEKLDIGIERESNNVDKEHVLKEAPQAKEPHQMKQSLLMNVTQPIVRKRSIEPELEVKMSNKKSCDAAALPASSRESPSHGSFNKKENKVVPLLNRVDQIEMWKAGATDSLEKRLELNKKLVEENKRLVEENKKLVEIDKKLVETNTRLVETDKKFIETNKRLESRLHKLEQLIIGDEE